MKVNRRRVIVGVLALIVVLVGSFVAAPIVRVILFMEKTVRRAERGQKHLFFETDYQELLTACRDLSRRAASGDLKKCRYQVFMGDRDAETFSFPQVILDLEPAFVTVQNGGVIWIELLPGPEWFSVVAFPDSREEWGNVKLIDGLWYHDSEYRDEYPDYMEMINALIEKGRQSRASRESTQPRQP